MPYPWAGAEPAAKRSSMTDMKIFLNMALIPPFPHVLSNIRANPHRRHNVVTQPETLRFHDAPAKLVF
jgi:hypothetical protein